MRGSPSTNRDGFIMPVVLFTLAIMSIMVVVALATANDEHRASQALRESGAALYAAEAGVNLILPTVNVDPLKARLIDTILPGDTVDFGWQPLPDGARYHAVLRRIDTTGQKMYLLNVEGRGSGPRAGQRLVTMMALTLATANHLDFSRAAVTTSSNMELVSDPTSTISGVDTNPVGWSCAAPGPPMPGVLVRSMAGMSQGPGTIIGTPPIAVDPTINASSFNQFGDVSYAELVGMATKFYPPNSQPSGFGPVVTGGVCDESANSNWGDPLNPGAPCFDYFPIIHFAGDVEFTTLGAAGQGIMLVDGDMHVGGGDFTFFGLIIVKGSCVFEYDSKVHGGVLCANQANVPQEIGDAAPLTYSSCALQRALAGAGVGVVIRPLSERAWNEILR